MSFKCRICRFTKSVLIFQVADTLWQVQRKAAAFERKNKTAGKRSNFN